MQTDDVTRSHDLEAFGAALPARVAEVMAAAPNYSQTLQRLVGLFVPAVADWCAIDLFAGAVPYRAATAEVQIPGWYEEHLALHASAISPRLTQRLIETAATREARLLRLQTLEDVGMQTAPPRMQEFLSRVMPVNMISAPLISFEQSIGVLTTIVRRDREPYAERDLERMRVIASLLAPAIHNAELREQQQLLFDANPIPMYVFDEETRGFLVVNEAAVRQYGWSREELLGMTIAAIRPREDVPLLEAALNSPERWRSVRVFRHQRKDGSIIRVEIHANDVHYRGRRACLVQAIDVSEHQAILERLQLSEERHRLVSLAAREVIWDYNLRTGRLEWNPMLYELFRYTPDQVEPTILWKRARMHPEDVDHARAQLRAAMNDRQPVLVREYRFQRGDGTWADVSDAAYIAYDAEGPTHIVGAITDVTLRRQSAQHMATAQRMEAVGRLAGGIAHDFNNLLTGIRGFASFVLDTLPPGTQSRRDTEEILSATERAAGLTQQLLAFSRRQVLQPEVIHLNELVRHLGQFLGRVVPESIDIEYVLAADLWPVFADAGQMEQVVVNLVVNARDAVELGGRITIETSNAVVDESYVAGHPGSLAGDFAVITVTDTGHGMDAATLARIFEPFFTTKEREQGTGLGLATSYGIVQQSGGFIWVYSEPGRGSSFKVHLPRSASRENAPRSPTPAPLRIDGNETLLLIEDDPGVRRVAALSLRHHGYEVLEAATPEEARDQWALRGPSIALVVSDVVLPRVPGPRLVAEMREARPTLRVLYVSGYTENAMSRDGLLQPGVDLLDKPFSPEQLVRRVRDALDRP